MTLRSFSVETRAEVAGNTLRGHAAVFDTMAEVPGHYERMAAGAFDEALKTSDAAALVNHDRNLLLARQSAGTLRLGVDGKGLAFEIDLPDTTLARDLRANIANYGGMSFGFIEGDDEWGRAPDGRRLRTHTNVARLMDVSVVTFPAYQGTDVALRSLDTFTFARPPTQRSQLIVARHRARTMP